MNRMLKHLISPLLVIVTSVAMANSVVFPSFQSKASLDEVMDNIKDAVIGRGLNISNTLHASEMLNRTGADIGYADNVYQEAQILEFCSVELSHQLVVANPNNIVLCPFTISVYQLTKDPGITHVSYRVPVAGEESKEVVARVDLLIQEILEEALE